MTEDDLSDIEHLQAYQARMKKLYTLDKFAFVDTDGLIYTSFGTQNDIETILSTDFIFQRTPDNPEGSKRQKQEGHHRCSCGQYLSLDAQELTVCFMEIDMNTMLEGRFSQLGS